MEKNNDISIEKEKNTNIENNEGLKSDFRTKELEENINKLNNDEEENKKSKALKDFLKMDNHDRGKVASAYALLTQIAIQVLVIMVMTFFIGKWIDEKLGTSPLFLFIFILLGMGSSFKSIYDIGMNQVNKYKKNDRSYKSYKKYDYTKDDDENSDF